MTAEGYYFFDGSAWQKVTGTATVDATTTAKGIVQLAGDLSGTAASPAIAGNAVTSAKILDGTVANADLASDTGGIYKGSGSLSGNTTVTQGTNNLAFTSSATNGFSVDGTTLSVDAANDRVGIGTTSPTTPLDVAGNVNISPKSGTASSLNLLENTANGNNMISLKSPASVTTDRIITLPSNAPSSGYALITDASGNTSWGAINPSASTLSSIALTGASTGVPITPNATTPGSTTSQRFFQTFDTAITNPLNNFNITTGTYTAPQPGNYLVTAYIVPNASPYNNTSNFYYPINLEVRKNCAGSPNGGSIVMDASAIRYATPASTTLRYAITVSGMLTLSAGDTLDLVVFLNGLNALVSDVAGASFPVTFTYATVTTYKALFSVTAL